MTHMRPRHAYRVTDGDGFVTKRGAKAVSQSYIEGVTCFFCIDLYHHEYFQKPCVSSPIFLEYRS